MRFTEIITSYFIIQTVLILDIIIKYYNQNGYIYGKQHKLFNTRIVKY